MERLGGVRHARDETHVRESGILSDIGLRVRIHTHVLRVGVGEHLRADDLTLGIHGHGDLDRIVGVALRGGEKDRVAETGGLGIDALHGLRNVGKLASGGAVAAVEKIKALRAGENIHERPERLGSLAQLDARPGPDIETGEQQSEHEKENDQRQSRAEKAAFILHFSALPIRAA